MKKTLKQLLASCLVVAILICAAPLSGINGFDIPDWADFSIKSSAAADEQNDALCHDFEEWQETTPATCTEDGLRTRKCSRCDQTETEVIPAGHKEEVDEAIEATCTATGLTEGKHCSACGEILVAQEEIAKKCHTEEIDAAVEATCTETGLTEGKHCSACGEILVAQDVIDALGHNYGKWSISTPATCTNTGRMSRICSVCRYVENEIIPVAGHSYVEAVTAPTCTEVGYTTYTCTICDYA